MVKVELISWRNRNLLEFNSFLKYSKILLQFLEVWILLVLLEISSKLLAFLCLRECFYSRALSEVLAIVKLWHTENQSDNHYTTTPQHLWYECVFDICLLLFPSTWALSSEHKIDQSHFTDWMSSYHLSSWRQSTLTKNSRKSRYKCINITNSIAYLSWK